MSRPQIETVTVTYKDSEIECAKITTARASTFRLREILDINGTYAWQFVIKANSANSVIVTVGNKSRIFDISTEFERYENIYTDVNAEIFPYVDITFPAGVFYILHTQLEHGQVATDWSDSPADINDFIQRTYTVATQTATMFSWLVAGGDSSTTFTLTDRVAELVAQYINLHGLVQIGGLAGDAQNALGIANAVYGSCDNSNASTTVYAQLDSDTLPTLTDGDYYAIRFKLDNTTEHFLGWQATGQSPLSAKPMIYNGAFITTGIWNAGDATTFRYNSGDITISGTTYTGYYELVVLSNEVVHNKVLSKLGALCTNMAMTILNGGCLATGSVDADKVKANAVFAQHLTAQNLDITGGTVNINTDTKEESIIKLNHEDEDVGEVTTSYTSQSADMFKVFCDDGSPDDIENGAELTNLGLWLHYKNNLRSEEFETDVRPGYAHFDDGTYEMGLENGAITCKNKSNDDYCEVGEDGVRVFTNNDEEFIYLGPRGGSITNNNGGFDFLNQYNTVAGKATGITVQASETGTATIMIPYSRVGIDKPVVTLTSNNADCVAYIDDLTLDNTNQRHVITMGLKNLTNAAIQNAAIHYVVMPYMT